MTGVASLPNSLRVAPVSMESRCSQKARALLRRKRNQIAVGIGVPQPVAVWLRQYCVVVAHEAMGGHKCVRVRLCDPAQVQLDDRIGCFGDLNFTPEVLEASELRKSIADNIIGKWHQTSSMVTTANSRLSLIGWSLVTTSSTRSPALTATALSLSTPGLPVPFTEHDSSVASPLT